MEKLLYLGGPIDGLSYDGCVGWREYAIRELKKDGITGLSPMRAKEFLKKHHVLVDGIEKHVLTTDKGITTRDLWDVSRCDAVLFNLLGAKKISVGTVTEYGGAGILHKPIITVMEKKGNVHEHPMIRELTWFRVETLEEGLDVVRDLFVY